MEEAGNFISLIVILIIFLGTYYKRETLYKYINYKINCLMANIAKVPLELLCYFNYRSLLTTILLPIFLILLTWTYLIYFNFNITPETISFFSTINSILLYPLLEEILFRGLALGCLVTSLHYLTKEKLKWRVNMTQFIFLIGVGIVLISTSAIFSYSHDSKIDLRFAQSMIYGIVYLVDKKNLLPSFLAHSLNNIIVLFFFGCTNC